MTRPTVLAVFAVLLLLLTVPVMAGEAATNLSYDVKVMVDNQPVVFPDQKAFINNSSGRTYVPLRFVTERLGAEVEWNQQDKTAVVKKGGKTIKAPVGSNRPTVDGVAVHLDAPVILVNARTMVPLRFMSETIGAEVEWNSAARTVYIKAINESDDIIDEPSDTGKKEITPGSIVEVTADNLNVRNGPGSSNSVLWKVKKGDKLTVIESSQNWCKVKLADGRIGWVSKTFVAVVGKEDQGQTGPESGEQGETDKKDGSSTVTDWTVEEVDGNLVTTITSSGAMVHDIFTLTAPSRVVVDLKGVQPGELPGEIEVESNLVKKIRTGLFSENPSTVRLVFDVNKPVMFNATKGDNGKGTELTLKLYVPDLGTSLKGKVIAIDPGHGGSDPGAVGPTGLKEKDVNMDVGLLTANLLRQNGAQVVMTRTTDTYVDLYQRTKIAGNAGAGVFVSIHMNAHPDASTAGTSTYYRRDDVPGLGVSQQDNRMLAQQIQSQLVQYLNRRNIGLKQANFVVLRTAAMPAVLVEASFISNPEEEALLRKDTYRAKIAEAIAKGIAYYFAQKES